MPAADYRKLLRRNHVALAYKFPNLLISGVTNMSTRHHLKKVISLSLAVALATPLLVMAQQAEHAQTGAHNHTQAQGQQGQGQRQGQGDGHRRMQVFSRLDSNGDGALNFDEFSAMPRPENRPEGANADAAIEQRFTRMDTDGNGLLSPEELQQGQRRGNGGGMRQQGQNEMRQRMENMTPEQREQMRERMQQMTPEQRQQMMQRRQGGNAAPATPAAPTSN